MILIVVLVSDSKWANRSIVYICQSLARHCETIYGTRICLVPTQ